MAVPDATTRVIYHAELLHYMSARLRVLKWSHRTAWQNAPFGPVKRGNSCSERYGPVIDTFEAGSCSVQLQRHPRSTYGLRTAQRILVLFACIIQEKNRDVLLDFGMVVNRT